MAKKDRWRPVFMAGGIGILVLLVLMGALGSAEATALLPLSQTWPANGQPTLTVSGPDTAWLRQVVTYNVYVTVSASYLGIYYLFPGHFVILQTDPITSSSEPGVLRWGSSQLSGHNILTVTGKYGLGGCSPVVHTAGFFDPYNSQLPTASKTTVIVDLRCTFLPLTLRGYP